MQNHGEANIKTTFEQWLIDLSSKRRWSWLAEDSARQDFVGFVTTDLGRIIHDILGWQETSAFDVTVSSKWQGATSELLAKDSGLDNATLGLASRAFNIMDLFCQEQERLNRPKRKKKASSKSADNDVQDLMKPATTQADEANLQEGALRQVSVTTRERNPKARQACLRRYGYVCQACGFDFEAFYGSDGHQFIEVHHLTPIATYNNEHVVDSEEDMVPLCSNCHSMIHRAGTDHLHPISLQQLKDLIEANGRR